MSYAINRTSFKAIRQAGSLASLYCQLIAVELALKDELQAWNSGTNGGHNIPDLLTVLATTSTKAGVTNQRAQINGLRNAFKNQAKKLYCQDQHGKCRSLPHSSYPHIRYLRHTASGWVGKTTDAADIAKFEATVSNIIVVLTKSGVQI